MPTNETTLLTNTPVLTQAVQLPRRQELPPTLEAGAPPSMDKLDEGLNNSLTRAWDNLMSQADGQIALAPTLAEQKPVTQTAVQEPVKTPQTPKPTMEPGKAVVVPAQPQNEKPRPQRKSKAPDKAPEHDVPVDKGERPKEGKPAPSGPSRSEESRKEVVRDRSQLEARVAETEQFARELSARETLVQQTRSMASAKRSEAAMLRSRVAEERAALSQFDLEFEDLVAQPGAFLDRFEEVERMQLLRYQMQAEIQQDEQQSREAEAEADHYAALAAQQEHNLQEGRNEVERRRSQIAADRETIERKATDAERAAGLMDHTASPGALMFWSALARAGDVEQASYEARRAQDQLDAHNADATSRLMRTLDSVRNGNVGAELVTQLQRRVDNLNR